MMIPRRARLGIRSILNTHYVTLDGIHIYAK